MNKPIGHDKCAIMKIIAHLLYGSFVYRDKITLCMINISNAFDTYVNSPLYAKCEKEGLARLHVACANGNEQYGTIYLTPTQRLESG